MTWQIISSCFSFKWSFMLVLMQRLEFNVVTPIIWIKLKTLVTRMLLPAIATMLRPWNWSPTPTPFQCILHTIPTFFSMHIWQCYSPSQIFLMTVVPASVLVGKRWLMEMVNKVLYGIIYKSWGRSKKNPEGMVVHPQFSNSGAITTCRLKGQSEGAAVTQALSIGWLCSQGGENWFKMGYEKNSLFI